MKGEVRAHLLAGFLVLDAVSLAVAEPEFGVVIVTFAKPFGLEDVLQDGFSENALHLALPLEGLGQVLFL